MIKLEATRSEGDYRREMRLARLCSMVGKDVVLEVTGVKEGGVRGACTGARSRSPYVERSRNRPGSQTMPECRFNKSKATSHVYNLRNLPQLHRLYR